MTLPKFDATHRADISPWVGETTRRSGWGSRPVVIGKSELHVWVGVAGESMDVDGLVEIDGRAVRLEAYSDSALRGTQYVVDGEEMGIMGVPEGREGLVDALDRWMEEVWPDVIGAVGGWNEERPIVAIYRDGEVVSASQDTSGMVEIALGRVLACRRLYARYPDVRRHLDGVVLAKLRREIGGREDAFGDPNFLYSVDRLLQEIEADWQKGEH